jgi:hypothetical protein
MSQFVRTPPLADKALQTEVIAQGHMLYPSAPIVSKIVD